MLSYFSYLLRKKSIQLTNTEQELANFKDTFGNYEHAKKLLDLEKERYRITNQLTNDIIFEYDIASDILTNSLKFQEYTGKPPIIYNVSKVIPFSSLFQKKDKKALLNLYKKIKEGTPTLSAEIKILDRKQKDHYNWWHIKGQTIYNDHHQPIKFVGKIVNIDAQKREIEKLQAKAHSDPLTGLYNKMITQSLINDFIKTKKHRQHAFMMIDIDNFKSINDNLGHLVGDEVLIDVTTQLKSLFGKHDIVGRIGGDEFVVFLYNIHSIKEICTKANAITQVLRTHASKQDKNYKISGSIGISIYPQDGQTYHELLKQADKALYKIKKDGKDNFAFANSPAVYFNHFNTSDEKNETILSS
ncbi:sensor domain-containing diguanylate cyclase [Anaerosinus massiliensis]|uniref:sensor domain-containing diguanylate cyclase n=1 Tax=Massilibacillus massiliensis TaxID=1806837 RepID=UPI000ADCD5C2|nr:GGDEF domain-containing protein [Massilibacillus massiliensis]